MALKLDGNINVRTPGWFVRADLRPVKLVTPDLLNPRTTDAGGPLVDGEFIYTNADGEGVRALDDGGNPAVLFCTKPVKMVFSGAGRTDTRYRGMCSAIESPFEDIELDTAVFDPSNLTKDALLMVGSVTIGGKVKSGYKLATTGAPVWGQVVMLHTKTPDGQLRVKVRKGVAP